MKDEIKEILIRTKEQQAIDVFKEFIETKGNLVTDYSLETYMQVILDYITNLQEENKRLKDVIDDNEENAKYLLRENKDLERQLDTALSDYEIYRDRCDKAIEKLYCYGEAFDRKILQQFQKEMLSILKGE